MTMTLLRFIVWGFLMLCWLCLISLIIYSCSLCSRRQTVRDKVSLMWGLCCFPYCKMWNMLQLLVSVTLAEAPISLRRCAAYLVPVVLWVVFCCTGFPYQHSSVNQPGGDCISHQGLEGRIHIMWIATGYQRTSALRGCLQSSDFRS